MTAGEPTHPALRVSEDMSVGSASVAKAFVGGTRSRAGGTLMQQYEHHLRRLQAERARQPADPEAVAMRASAQRLFELVEKGASADGSLLLSHGTYRKHGGKSPFAAWAKKVVLCE